MPESQYPQAFCYVNLVKSPTRLPEDPEIVDKSKLQRPSETLAIRHLKEFGIGIPAHQPVCLGDIVNAGWLRYAEIVRSAGDPRNVSEELDNLNEMLLKTVEVLEYLRRVS